jgi:hypothetical protein
VVLDRAGALPDDVVITAVAAPYTSFRDRCVAPRQLDYGPLVRVAEERPECRSGLAKELAPGHGYCRITAGEVDEALRGVASPLELVRRHAVGVLGERALGVQIARRVLPALSSVALDDPDPVVRRIAVVSLHYWHRESRPYLDTGRAALADPDPTVRAAAAGWLREHADR